MIDTQPVDGTTSSENTAAAMSMETNPQQFQVSLLIATYIPIITVGLFALLASCLF